MLEGNIIKSVIVQDQETKGAVLMGVAQHCDEKVNFKVPYNWESLDYKWFIAELREKLAEALDIPVYWMNVDEKRLLEKMKNYSSWMESQ